MIDRIAFLRAKAEELGIGYLEIAWKDQRVAFKLPPKSLSAAPVLSTPESTGRSSHSLVAENELALIRAQIVGVFRNPERPLEEGDTVAVGQVVGSIESMRIHNSVLADVDGVVVRRLVGDGDPVEYAQPLFEVSEASR